MEIHLNMTGRTRRSAAWVGDNEASSLASEDGFSVLGRASIPIVTTMVKWANS